MSLINIRPAERRGARALVALAGVSGSGKTHTAILLGYGLAGYNASKLGFLDTENKRGSLYASVLERCERPTKERFMLGDLAAPFSPARYTEAILEFQKLGVEVLVIDSVTHEWEGVGGCDDIANASNAKGEVPKFPRWNLAKREHKRFINTLLQSDMHVICCLRAREKVKVLSGGAVEPLGLQPIQEKNFMFECTVSAMLHDEGRRHDRLKVPSELVSALPGEGYLGARTGEAIRNWLTSAAPATKADAFRNRLLAVAEKGESYMRSAWLKVPEATRLALGEDLFSELIESARAFDLQRALADSETAESVAEVNREVRLATDQAGKDAFTVPRLDFSTVPPKQTGPHLDFS